MSKLNDFLSKAEGAGAVPDKPVGVEWHAGVLCQFCSEPVEEQTLYPTEYLLAWKCSQGHRSFIEGYTAF